MKHLIQLLFLCAILFSCQNNNTDIVLNESGNFPFIAAVDISAYPEISSYDPIFFNLAGAQQDFLDILKENGVNTIRLRLWVNPRNEHSGFAEVKQFSNNLKSKGFKTWLTLHYSDTWADPGQQETPNQWQGIDTSALNDSVYAYTEKVVRELQPNYIQIGNEINPGFLHPYGRISNNGKQFVALMQSAITAVRSNSNDAQIIIHFAGIDGSDWFFDQVEMLDYDIIGLSYYPKWHGKSFNSLQLKMEQLSMIHQKQIVIAETAYPFTLDWNDWTNNIVGQEDQLILPDFPATKEGQRKFIMQLIKLTKEVENGIGFCYWGAELISWKGNKSNDASPWENQALFDFDNKALPVLGEFNTE